MHIQMPSPSTSYVYTSLPNAQCLKITQKCLILQHRFIFYFTFLKQKWAFYTHQKRSYIWRKTLKNGFKKSWNLRFWYFWLLCHSFKLLCQDLKKNSFCNRQSIGSPFWIGNEFLASEDFFQNKFFVKIL